MNLREAEAKSIREFVQNSADSGYIRSNVLDYGCGKQPYRDIVERALPLGGVYSPFDQAAFPANVSGRDFGQGDPLVMQGWGTILCTQVVQYVPHVSDLFLRFRFALADGGHLVMTYPTNWPEVESADLHRFTKAGMARLLTEAGFEIVNHTWRHGFRLDTGESFTAGYGAVATVAKA